ncbi:hypothetical protein WICPIJ_003573 [Wickerhamomyces pijperi]|uniref:Altered inheritance of mitochondria protein 6 n=1 Tax=Wickerhamomyces pijperi TaxID=599730 RepID=A0A9P8TMW4_WICPI|nr:hypothetical protein WICPIJ_003573 [Wickerhamomyces pijperi]
MQPFDYVLEDEDIKELRKDLKHTRIKFTFLSIFTTFIIFGGMMLFKTEKTPTYLQDLVRSHGTNEDLFRLNDILLNSQTIAEDLNRGKRALSAVSYQDYKRRSPLLEALELGIGSVEVDAWYMDGIDYDLFVGTHQFGLTSYRTINSLYLGILNKLLDQLNPKNSDGSVGTMRGPFYDDPSQSFNLVIDVKNNPDMLFRVLQRNLEVFQLKKYLTTYDTVKEEWYHGPITIMLTGDVPFDSIRNQTVRNCFVDAPLKMLHEDESKFSEKYPEGLTLSASGTLYEITGSKSAGNDDNGLSSEQLSTLSTYINTAHKLGLKVRITELPVSGSFFSPDSKAFRERIWTQLLQLSVDVLDIEHIKDCYDFLVAYNLAKAKSSGTENLADVKHEKEEDFEMEEIKESHAAEIEKLKEQHDLEEVQSQKKTNDTEVV